MLRSSKLSMKIGEGNKASKEDTQNIMEKE
jgi:hypothetical protein